MSAERVLITGAAGVVGTILRNGLADEFEVSGLDLKRIPGFNSTVGNTAKMGRRAERAFRGQDVVIDLAGNPSTTTPWEVVRSNNLPASMNALDAAARHGVRRVIYASSNHVTGNYELEGPYAQIVRGERGSLDPAAIPLITTRHPLRPDGPYGIGKVLGEAAGRYYADQHGLSVICLRIGTCNRSGRPQNERHFSTLLTHEDLLRLVRCAISAPPEPMFGVFYGVSANTWRFWDISDAREAIGYEPMDDAETWRAEWEATVSEG
jgi:nucleoside-diphosphate-sugar epimerase